MSATVGKSAAELATQWTTKREVELEDRALIESKEKLERNLNVSIERDDDIVDFRSADWAIAEKDTEVTAAAIFLQQKVKKKTQN